MTVTVSIEVFAGSPLLDRREMVTAVEEILDAGLLCVIEVCLDVPQQKWDRYLVIFKREAEAVADAVEKWIELMPDRDARLAGCTPAGLHSVPDAPTYLCYVVPAEISSGR